MNFLKAYILPPVSMIGKTLLIIVADKYLKISDRVVAMLPAMK